MSSLIGGFSLTDGFSLIDGISLIGGFSLIGRFSVIGEDKFSADPFEPIPFSILQNQFDKHKDELFNPLGQLYRFTNLTQRVSCFNGKCTCIFINWTAILTHHLKLGEG
jgi:hypothetical protein